MQLRSASNSDKRCASGDENNSGPEQEMGDVTGLSSFRDGELICRGDERLGRLDELKVVTRSADWVAVSGFSL